MIKKTLTLLLFSIMILSLVGCFDSQREIKSGVNGIHINVLEDPMTLDPRKGADFVSGSIQFLLFEGLVRMTPDSLSSPGIAKKIDVSEDGLIYTFHLRDAKWSNGVPITAYDFSKTWVEMLDPNFPAPNAHLLYPIKNAEKAKRGEVSLREVGVSVLNYNTLQVVLETPTPYFEELITFSSFYPICQHFVQENEKWCELCDRSFICNGPYRIAKRKVGRKIILEKNPHYWDADSIKLEQIEISIIDNEKTALNLFENNELDLLGIPFKGIPSDSIPDLRARGLIKTTEIPATTICCFNLNRFPFTNKNIRKAFAYAINRKAIIEHVTQLDQNTGQNLLPNNLIDNQPEPFFTDGDDDSARKYLEMGLKELDITIHDLPKLTLLHASTGVYPKVAQAIQDQWRKTLGIHVELDGFEYKVFLDRLNKKDYCIGQCVWIAQYPDPMNILDRFRIKENTKNYPGFENKKYKEILKESMVEQNKDKRYKKLRDAIAILNEEVPMTAIYHWNSSYLVKDHIEGLQFNKSGFCILNNIEVNQDKTPKNRPLLTQLDLP